jgi:dihydrolipoamide dehydrogenase
VAEDKSYDLVVIGAGPGGYFGAIRAAQLGLKTACIEKDPPLGGTCLNVGCIPSKALLDSSERYEQAQHELSRHGIKVSGVALDLDAMMKRKEKVVDGLTKGVASLFKKYDVDRIQGHARITAPGEIRVEGTDAGTIRTKRILIATGSVPIELKTLPFDGERIISSTEALSLTEVPARMLVVGGGYIGLEMGSVWSRLGTKVTVVELTEQIAPGTDRQMAEELFKVLRRQGLKFQLETTAKSAKAGDGGVAVVLESKGVEKEESYDVVLVAVGRRAYTGGLGLEDVGVAIDERGRIPVDAEYRTNVEGIYAIGDCTPGPMLAHKAEDEAVVCVERICGIAAHLNYDAIPGIVYTAPELATVGMSEERARKEVGDLKIGTFPFRANSRARCVGQSDGLVKVIADAKTDRLLGVHIVGPAASELIAEAAVAIEFHASAEDIARSVHAHPTFAEALREAAMAVGGHTINF